MSNAPCGRLATSMVHATVTCELALGMDATLEAAQREISQVRAILSRAVDGLVTQFGESARREGVVALQFQDISDQYLARAGRRIEMVRSVLGRDVSAPIEGPSAEAIKAGAAEFFKDPP